MQTRRPLSSRFQKGLSLIELMVAMLIGLLLVIGMIQIFGASRATYQMQDGLSRVQESGRYTTQFLQRRLRMVGYMGCGSDAERMTQASFVNHLATYSASAPGGDAVDPLYRFQRPIEAFSADSLPTYLNSLNPKPLAGTSVLVLRVPSDESVPVTSVNQDPTGITLTVGLGTDAATTFAGDTKAVPYMLESCRSADILVGTLGGTAALPTITVVGAAGLNKYKDPTVTSCTPPTGGCPWDFRISNVFLNAPAGGQLGDTSTALQLNAVMHRAQYQVFYVAKNTTNGLPSLYMRQLKANDVTLDVAQELAEGVENLQLRFGVDTDGDGQVDKYRTAEEVVDSAGTDVALDAKWRNVLSVRVGMLLRSPDRAGVSGKVAGVARTFTVLGTTITPADDGAMRQVYETTIALRNRIFNS